MWILKLHLTLSIRRTKLKQEVLSQTKTSVVPNRIKTFKMTMELHNVMSHLICHTWLAISCVSTLIMISNYWPWVYKKDNCCKSNSFKPTEMNQDNTRWRENKGKFLSVL